MTLDLSTPTEMVLYFDGEIRKLEGRAKRLAEQLSGRSLKSDFTKLAAAQLELETVEQEIERLKDERAEAQAALDAEQRAQQAQENEVASALRQHAELAAMGRSVHRLTLADVAQRVAQIRATCARHGADDPGPVRFDTDQIWQQVDHDPFGNAAFMAAIAKDRATPEQEAAYRKRRDVSEQLFRDGHNQASADAIASMVADDGLTLDEALERFYNPSDETEEEEELIDDDVST